MRLNNTRQIALGGVLAAVAVVIMCLGGFIPIATYVCPMLCCVTQFIVFCFCGKRIAWAWFAVVSILSVLMGPDKEAVIVFLVIGYYPLIKNVIDQSKIRFLFKLFYFNISIFLAYTVLIYVFGMREIIAENMELGIAGLILIFLLGNVTFFLLDRLINMISRKLR